LSHIKKSLKHTVKTNTSLCFSLSNLFLACVQDFPMSGGPEGGNMGPIGPNSMGPVLNGDGMEGMKNSPANGGPGTPREDSGSGMGDYNLGGFGGPGENVSINSSGSYFSES